MRRYLRGEIYYANLDPVFGSEQSGFRPVLIIQNDIGNRYSPTVIVAPITSKPDVKANYQPSTGALHFDFGIPSPEQYDYAVSHGTVDLTLPGGMRVNRKVYSEEIPHGLGPGTVDVRLSIEFSDHGSEDETALCFGNSEIFVKSGKTFNTGSQGRLVIGGEIKTEPSPGLDYTTNNLFQVRGEWAGTVVIGPGEGITNNLGRMYVGAGLEVTNGVFRLAAGGQKMGGHSLVEILNVTGNGSSFSNTKGHLKLTAGELYSTQNNYSEVSNYGHVEVVGGRINTPNSHWLMGLTGPSKLSVSNGGEFVVGEFRLGQTKACKNEMNLGKGGVIRPKKLLLEYGNDQDVTFNFDGGRFQSNVADDAYSTLFYASTHAKWDGVNFCVREGGAVLDSSFGKHVWWARPLVSGAEHDGGLTCVMGKNKDVVLCDKAAPCSYNGPTRTVFTTGTNFGSLQCRVADVLPGTTTLQIGPHTQIGFNSSWSSGHDLDQTVARVEGLGNVVYCTKLVVTNGIAAVFDGEYGTLTFGNTCSLAGDYTIVGNTNGCGCVKFNQSQDVSSLSLAFADVEKMDSHARSDHYKIVDAPNGIAGMFDLAADWPRGWAVKYASDRKSVYVYHQNGTQIIVR